MNKILIIEDSKPLLHALRTKLIKAGYLVECSQNGEEGIEKVLSFKPDLILLDVIVPRLNGYEILAKLKEKKIHTPTIVISNLSEKEDIEKGMNLGAVAFLIKCDNTLLQIIEKIKLVLNN